MHSPLFLVRKVSGKWSLVLDLKNLKSYLKPHPFQMESLTTVTTPRERLFSSAGELGSSVFSEIFLCRQPLPVQMSPFGLSLAPRTFLKGTSHSDCVFAEKRHTHISLFGRCSDACSIQESFVTAQRSGLAYPIEVCMDDKFGEKPARSMSIPCVFGHDFFDTQNTSS